MSLRTIQTPVDLSHYTVRTRTPEPMTPVAVRQSIVRRQAIDLSQPMALAAGGEDQVMEGLDESSPLDVPAFLRQREG